jgi:hypothetical protein
VTAKYFSDQFGLEVAEDDDWFAPILGADTRLFVDPFLIFKDDGELWVHAHDELIAYFNIVFHMVGNTDADDLRSGADEGSGTSSLPRATAVLPRIH